MDESETGSASFLVRALSVQRTADASSHAGSSASRRAALLVSEPAERRVERPRLISTPRAPQDVLQGGVAGEALDRRAQLADAGRRLGAAAAHGVEHELGERGGERGHGADRAAGEPRWISDSGPTKTSSPSIR